jgi:two-component system, NtrC family, sensor histidine kinase PilS
VLDELALVAAADPRFAGIEIRRAYPPGTSLLVDGQQLSAGDVESAHQRRRGHAGRRRVDHGLDPETQRSSSRTAGPGIADALRKKIFNPFFTTKEHGTGLGLATVHAIVEAHGGTLDLATSPLGGAKFVIRL